MVKNFSNKKKILLTFQERIQQPKKGVFGNSRDERSAEAQL
jgi:hypothetical protein